MSTWKYAKVAAFALLAWGCGMAESAEFQPKPPDGASTVGTGEETGKLDADVTALLRDKYAIVSARYYRVAGDVPWLAVAKSVQKSDGAENRFSGRCSIGTSRVSISSRSIRKERAARPSPSPCQRERRPIRKSYVGFYVLGVPAGAKK
jgi:hypothetical protein